MPRQDSPCSLWAPFAMGRDNKFLSILSPSQRGAAPRQHHPAWPHPRTASPSTAGLAIQNRYFWFLHRPQKQGVKRGLKVAVSPPPDRNPLLGVCLLCPTKLGLEEKETSAPIYGELGEVRLGGRDPLLPPQTFGITRSAMSHVPAGQRRPYKAEKQLLFCPTSQ